MTLLEKEKSYQDKIIHLEVELEKINLLLLSKSDEFSSKLAFQAETIREEYEMKLKSSLEKEKMYRSMLEDLRASSLQKNENLKENFFEIDLAKRELEELRLLNDELGLERKRAL